MIEIAKVVEIKPYDKLKYEFNRLKVEARNLRKINGGLRKVNVQLVERNKKLADNFEHLTVINNELSLRIKTILEGLKNQ